MGKYIYKNDLRDFLFNKDCEYIDVFLQLAKIINYKLTKFTLYYNDENLYKLINNHRIVFINDLFYVVEKSTYIPTRNALLLFACSKFLKPFPEINDGIDWNYINVYYTHIEFFEVGKSNTINYENKDRLIFLQKELVKCNNVRKIEGYPGDSTLKKEWWMFRGWSEDYAIQKIKEIQKNNGLKWSKKIKENPEKYIGYNQNQIEYWLKRDYDYDSAKLKVKERQTTFTLEKCIQKYGEIEGKKRYQERQDKWQKTLREKDNYIEILEKKTKSLKFASKVSQELFNSIYQEIKNLNLNVYYHDLNHEYGLSIHKRGGVLYDFVIPELKYAIEYNGERFHPNKNKLTRKEWKEWKNPYTKEDANTVYKKDLQKNNALINRGFVLDVVWDLEYKENKNKIISIIVDKIKNLYYEKFNKS